MNLPTSKRENLSTLDYVFTVLSNRKTHLDFALSLYLPKPPSVEALEIGAASARNKYPITNSFVYRGRWEYLSTNDSAIEVRTDAGRTSLEQFMDAPFDLRIETPCRQLLIKQNSGGAVLVTRLHHAAADGLSAAMWISHQLKIAFGFERPITKPTFYSRPQFRHSATSVRRSKFAYSETSAPLRACTHQRSSTRRWISFDFDATELKRACRKVGGFTYNDLLAMCTLEVLQEWNGDPGSKVGLWVPMNIRSRTTSGFGNGTSRIRIYPRYASEASFVEKTREVRRQIQWCSENGEWVVPNIPRFTSLPRWISAPALNAYLNSRFVDMATAVFSHADSWAGGIGEGLQSAERIECIGLLHSRQALAINGTTHRGRTCLTLTYDSGLLCVDAATRLAEMYQGKIESARQELRCKG